MALLIRQFIRLTAAQNHILTSHHFGEFQFHTSRLGGKGKTNFLSMIGLNLIYYAQLLGLF